MMTADDIRNHRQEAEQNDIDTEGQLRLASHSTLALWVIAEQLYEIRALFGILTERAEGKR